MSNAVEDALYDQLAGGTALVALLGGTAIYNGQAPRTAHRPYVVFSQASDMEENLTPTRSQRLVYLVKAVADSLLDAGAIADLIDARLQGTLSISGRTNFWTARLTGVRYLEYDPAYDHAIGHAGGEYVIRVEGG